MKCISKFRLLIGFVFLLSSNVLLGQYYDFSAKSSADEYLKLVIEKHGPKILDLYPRSDLLYLAGTLGRLDRISISPDVFLEHLDLAYKNKNRFYHTISDYSFREYILQIRIRSELTSRSSWRRQFDNVLSKRIGFKTDVDKAASIIFAWIDENVQVVDEGMTYPLNLKGDMDPLSTLRGGRGTEIDVAILAVAALRSIGIGARIIYAPVIAGEEGGKVWLEYRNQTKWVPWVPSAPRDIDGRRWLNIQFSGKWGYVLAAPHRPTNVTETYSKVARIWLCPYPLSHNKFDGAPMLVSEGRLQTISGRDIYNIEPENAGRGLGPGGYVVAMGDYTTLAGLSYINLENEQQGWCQMDFDKKVQELAVGGKKPSFFSWKPQERSNQVDKDLW